MPPQHAKNRKFFTARRRQWLYRVLIAVVPILIIYGVIDEQSAALWIALAAAVLGLGTADRNVQEDQEEEAD